MAETEDSGVDAWVASVLRLRLAYLQYLRLRGYDIPDSEIASLREEVRDPDAPELEQEVAELRDLLAFVDSVEENGGQTTKATLAKRGRTKLVMRPERNHARAHFHIEYKREHSASYAPDTLEPLAGSMPKKYEAPLLAWASRNQERLQVIWDRMNAGEDVSELIVIQDA